MKKRVLGRTGIEVSELAMGGLFVASWFGEAERAYSAVRRAIDLGVNYVDTAPMYGNSEEVLGQALKGVDAPVILSTKLGCRPTPFNPRDKDALIGSFKESLRLLGRDYIDILMIHEPDRPRQFDWWSDWANVDGPVMEVLHQLKDEGMVGYLGLGGTTAYEMAHVIKSGKFDVVLTAFNYSLLWREARNAVIPAAKAQGMGIIAGSPLQQGALSQRYDEDVNKGAWWLSPPRREQYKALYAFLDELDITLAELGIRFVISDPDISCVLMGARSAQEVEQNVAAVEKGPLPDDILRRLDEIAVMVPFRPFEEPFSMPFGRDYPGPGPAA